MSISTGNSSFRDCSIPCALGPVQGELLINQRRDSSIGLDNVAEALRTGARPRTIFRAPSHRRRVRNSPELFGSRHQPDVTDLARIRTRHGVVPAIQYAILARLISLPPTKSQGGLPGFQPCR